MKHANNNDKTRLIILNNNHELKQHLKLCFNWLHFCGVMIIFSVLVLRKVREYSEEKSTFALLLEKQNYKNQRRFLYRFEHATFVLLLKSNIVTCPIFRGISFKNVVMACAQCSKLYTVYNGIFSATGHVSCV